MPIGILGLLALPFGLDALLLAADGRRHRVDDCGGAVGHEPPGRGRPHGGFRGRAAADRQRRARSCSACCTRRCASRSAAPRRSPSCWRCARRSPTCWWRPSGDSFAVRGADGRLPMVKTGSDAFAIREWLAADARRAAGPRRTAAGARGHYLRRRLAASRASPTARSSPSRRSIEAFDEDCRRAVLVITARVAPPRCAHDRHRPHGMARRRGAGAASRREGVGGGVQLQPPGRGRGHGRPRRRQARPRAPARRPRSARRYADAAPRAEDLGADD